MKLDILAIGAHPDDIELFCAGTLLHHVQLGHKVGLLDLTAGELGTRGNAEIRLQEASAASQVIGASVRGNLGMADGFFEHNATNIKSIIEVLRLFQPKIVLANSVNDRHPDHGRAAKLIADACYYSGLKKIETFWEGQSQEAWRPAAVYHYIQDYHIKPDFVMDITPYIEKKFEAILAYRTQFFNPDMPGDKTPISGQDFLDFIKARARTFGRPAGFEFGEGFTVNRTIGVNNLMNLI